MGRFRAPSLRNIALTAPYMHDGSIAHADRRGPPLRGGWTHASAAAGTAGVGRTNPHKSEFVTGFTLTDEERTDLVAFLESLTDQAFISDPRFANPWPQK